MSIGPEELDRTYLWRVAARLGYDLVEAATGLPAESAGQKRAAVRSSHEARARALEELPLDAQALRARKRAERDEARKDRATRKANKVLEDPEGAVSRNDRLVADPEVTIVTRG